MLQDSKNEYDLDVGVIYTHERAFLPRLLTSLSESCDGIRARLILVDNASRQGVDEWRPLFQPMVSVCNDRRLNYAANLNRVLSVSSARYVLLMNTDMYLDPKEQCLSRMVQFMDSDPHCGLAGCRLLHADGSEAFAARRFQTFSTIVARRLAPKLMQGTIRHHLYQNYGPSAVFECDWLSGCFLLVRRTAWQQIGDFDTSFGKYFEDVDYCIRMQKAGWSVSYNGATSCYHLEQRASRNVLSRDAARHVRAYLRWLRKWHFVARPHSFPLRRAA